MRGQRWRQQLWSKAPVLSWCFGFLGLGFQACKMDTSHSPLREKPALEKIWQMKLPASSYIYPLRRGDEFLFSYHSGDRQCFVTCSASRGKIHKEWCLPLKSSKPLYYNLSPCNWEDKLVLPTPGGLLLIDPGEGWGQLWSSGFRWGENALLEKNGLLYRVYYGNNNRKAFVTALDPLTDSLRTIATLLAPDSATIHVKTPFLYTNKNGQDVLVLGYTHYNPTTRYTRNGMLSIDKDNGQVLIDILLDSINHSARGINHDPVVAGAFSYWMLQNEVLCYHHASGALRWKRTMPAPMVTSRPLVAHEMLYYAAEDGHLYALDLASGTVIWTAPISGSPSRVFVAGNYLFLVGGADGVLYVINARDGDVVLKKRSERHDLSAQVFFQRTFYADREYALLYDGVVWQCFSN